MSERAERIRRLLEDRLAPLHLSVEDESALHAGHAGARGGAGHYRVQIVAERFRGLAVLARHRLVYEAVRELLPHEVHALGIEAYAPGERASTPDFMKT